MNYFAGPNYPFNPIYMHPESCKR